MGDVGVSAGAPSVYIRRVDKSPAAIRAALPQAMRPAFETEFRAALATAADTFDIAPLDTVVRVWWTEALLCANPEVQAEVDETRRRIAAGDSTVFNITSEPAAVTRS